MASKKDFEKTKKFRKGMVGEKIIDAWLWDNGYIPYRPKSGAAHPFDRLCASRDKKVIFIVESKAKASRTYYPDTGIDYRHYKNYKYVYDKYGIDVMICFVDENKMKIYGNRLSILDKERTINHNGKEYKYPLKQNTRYGNKIIYFPLSCMRKISDIKPGEAEKLKELSTRNYAYGK